MVKPLEIEVDAIHDIECACFRNEHIFAKAPIDQARISIEYSLLGSIWRPELNGTAPALKTTLKKRVQRVPAESADAA
jgi:hypothetical protein